MTYLSIDIDSNSMEYYSNYKTKRLIIREFCAEFIGTFVMNLMVTGCAASSVLKGSNNSMVAGFGTAMGVLLGVLISISISGGHLNPIVTITLAITKKFGGQKIIVYLLAQYLGSFCATALVFLNYHNAIDAFDEGIRSAYGDKTSTGQIFTTFPVVSASIFGILLDQIICASIVMFAVMAIMDTTNIQMPQYLKPLIVSLIICGVIISFDFNCGAALNPARDVSARFFLILVGYGDQVFHPLNGFYWLIGGVIGPHLGAIIGSGIYLILIEVQHKSAEQMPLIQ